MFSSLWRPQRIVSHDTVMPDAPSVEGKPQGPSRPAPSQGPAHRSTPTPARAHGCRQSRSSQPAAQSPSGNLTLRKTIASPPSSRSARNAKNFPRHSSLYSRSSQLHSRRAKNLTGEPRHGATTTTCPIKRQPLDGTETGGSEAKALPSGLTQGYPARRDAFLASFWSPSLSRERRTSPESREGSVSSSTRHPGEHKTSKHHHHTHPGAGSVFQRTPSVLGWPRGRRGTAVHGDTQRAEHAVVTYPREGREESKAESRIPSLRKALLGQAPRLLSCTQAPGARREPRCPRHTSPRWQQPAR